MQTALIFLWAFAVAFGPLGTLHNQLPKSNGWKSQMFKRGWTLNSIGYNGGFEDVLRKMIDQKFTA